MDFSKLQNYILISLLILISAINDQANAVLSQADAEKLVAAYFEVFDTKPHGKGYLDENDLQRVSLKLVKCEIII